MLWTANKAWQSIHMPPIKENQTNQLLLPKRGHHNARQDHQTQHLHNEYDKHENQMQRAATRSYKD